MFAGKKSAQIREILISESAWEEMTCLFAPSLSEYGISKEAISNIQAILDAGFDAVQFDCDAELVDGLPAWDW
ncbi:hypothetical protein D4390_13970 [Salmonella enterica subsp. enterica serovar Oslo]|nr:hypothetical protein [Salmonella enterica subsp. enterica serovar Oslo]